MANRTKKKLSRSSHTLEGVSRACKILRVFQDDRQTFSLAEVLERTELERTVCFRLIGTLEEQGLLRRSDHRKYASNVRILSGKRFRIGYASQTTIRFAARSCKVYAGPPHRGQ
jgi:DNA-binding IclR family transcriptional regulator